MRCGASRINVTVGDDDAVVAVGIHFGPHVALANQFATLKGAAGWGLCCALGLTPVDHDFQVFCFCFNGFFYFFTNLVIIKNNNKWMDKEINALIYLFYN